MRVALSAVDDMCDTRTTMAVTPTQQPLPQEQPLSQPPRTLDALCRDGGVDVAAALDLPAMPCVTAGDGAQRVQVVLRGQRFEMTTDVAVTYCLVFRYFFGLPLALASLSTAHENNHEKNEDNDNNSDDDDDSDNAAAWQRVCPCLAATTTDASACVYAAAAVACDDAVASLPRASLSRVWRWHYTHTVLPRLERGIAALTTTTATTATRCDARAQHTSPPPPLPAMAQPVSIAYDRHTRVWQFAYRRRLPDDDNVDNGNDDKACAATTHTTRTDAATVDRNADPRVLLQPDYAGVLIAWLRRARQQGRLLPLPLRWHEMSDDQRLCLAQLVRALGVGTLLRTCGATPTASPATSLCAAVHDNDNNNNNNSDADRANDSDKDGNDDDVRVTTAAAAGCYACGRAGHAAVDCPFARTS